MFDRQFLTDKMKMNGGMNLKCDVQMIFKFDIYDYIVTTFCNPKQLTLPISATRRRTYLKSMRML